MQALFGRLGLIWVAVLALVVLAVPAAAASGFIAYADNKRSIGIGYSDYQAYGGYADYGYLDGYYGGYDYFAPYGYGGYVSYADPYYGAYHYSKNYYSPRYFGGYYDYGYPYSGNGGAAYVYGSSVVGNYGYGGIGYGGYGFGGYDSYGYGGGLNYAGESSGKTFFGDFSCSAVSLNNGSANVSVGSAGKATITLTNNGGQDFVIDSVNVRDSADVRASSVLQPGTVFAGSAGNISFNAASGFKVPNQAAFLDVTVSGHAADGTRCTSNGVVQVRVSGGSAAQPLFYNNNLDFSTAKSTSNIVYRGY